MSTLHRDLVYAFRKLSAARVFTATAVLTLALGVGGSTAIFTLMHAVMLKSLPVGDPDRLYRIGDGNNCCVQGGPQDRWGFFSFPLFERIKAETPQFEEITAFSTSVGRLGVRRQGVAAQTITNVIFSKRGDVAVASPDPIRLACCVPDSIGPNRALKGSTALPLMRTPGSRNQGEEA